VGIPWGRSTLLAVGAAATAIATGAAAVATGAPVATTIASAQPGPGATALARSQGAGQSFSYQPLRGATSRIEPDNTFGNVDYNGGPVMPSNTDYLIFWSPSGFVRYGPGPTPQYVSGLEQYFQDLAHDSGGHQNTDSVSAQYNDLTGASAAYSVTFGGALLDTDPYPPSQCPVNSPVTACLTDIQLQHELERVVASHHLRADLAHEYFVLTPPHVATCMNSNATARPAYGGCSAGEVPGNLSDMCAYHSNTVLSPMLIYAIDPYISGVPGCDDGNHPNGPSDGALEGGLSHEHNESISDPLPNDAWTAGAGSRQGEEIGDLCTGTMGPALGRAPDGAAYNQVINGHFYWYQEEWSNQGHLCLQRFTLSGQAPTAKFRISSASGLTMMLDATGSTAPGGVAEYVWQFNDAFGAQTVQSSGVTITHTFPVAGVYSIGLTVYGHDGTSTGTGAIVTTGQSSPTQGFTSSPPLPAAGQNVTFSGLTAISRKPVQTYLWEFGDGTIGSGANPTHAYAVAGTYTVTLVMWSGDGSAFPGIGAGPVFTRAISVR
jgi:hypothetical protein